MFDIILMILVCGLVVNGVVDIWLNSRLFAPYVSWLEEIQDKDDQPALIRGVLTMLLCAKCFSVWCGFVAVIVVYPMVLPEAGSVRELMYVFGFGVAVSRVSNIIHDYIGE